MLIAEVIAAYGIACARLLVHSDMEPVMCS